MAALPRLKDCSGQDLKVGDDRSWQDPELPQVLQGILSILQYSARHFSSQCKQLHTAMHIKMEHRRFWFLETLGSFIKSAHSKMKHRGIL